MNCQKCGETAKAGAVFCPNCGNKLEAPGSSVSPASSAKKRLKVWKLLVPAIVLIGAASAGLIWAGQSAASPDNLIETFRESIEDQDEKVLQSLLTSETDEWAPAAEDAAKLADFLREDPSRLKELTDKLEAQAAAAENGTISYEGSDTPYASVNLKKGGKKWLFFEGYSLTVTPVHVLAEVSHDGIELYMDGKMEEKQAREKETYKIGPLMPGRHSIKGILAGPYTSAEESEDFELYNEEYDNVYKEIKFKAGTVHSLSAYKDSALFINGKKTDITLSNESSKEIGLLPLDGSVPIHIEKKFPWGTYTSEDIMAEERYINFTDLQVLDESVQEDIMEMLNESWKQYVQTLNTVNPNKMKLMPEVSRKRAIRYVKNLRKSMKNYRAELRQAQYDLDSIKQPSYNKEKDRYELKVQAEYWLYEPNGSGYWFGKDGEEAVTSYHMHLYYDEKDEQWKIEDYEERSFILLSTDRTKVYRFDQ